MFRTIAVSGLHASSLGLLGASASGWFPLLADELAADPKRRRHCILLWMTGGPTQTDTFDMKPGHANGGEFKEVATKVPGLKFSEHLPKLGEMADRLAVVRSLSTKEGDHGRGTFVVRTGQQPQGPIQYPAIGSSLSKALGRERRRGAALRQHLALPGVQPGGVLARLPRPALCRADRRRDRRLRPQAAAAAGGYAELKVDDLTPPPASMKSQFAARLDLWRTLQSRFVANAPRRLRRLPIRPSMSGP